MSSNQYGFTCDIEWMGRRYSTQIVYAGTHDDSEESLNWATRNWEGGEFTDPVELAKYELANRDWDKKYASDKRIGLCRCYGGWLSDDPRDVSWRPPEPSEREVLEIIAAGKAEDIEYGWDT